MGWSLGPLLVVALPIASSVPATFDEPHAPARAPLQQERQRVSGRVQFDGLLPPGEKVVVKATLHLPKRWMELETEAAADGSFAFELPDGRLWGELRVESPFLDLGGVVVFEPGRADIILEPRLMAVVRGRVHATARDSLTFEPEGDRLRCGPIGVRRPTSDFPELPHYRQSGLLEEGAFLFDRLPPGLPMEVSASVGGMRARVKLAPLSPGETRWVHLALHGLGKIRGVVQDDQGTPVQHAFVSAHMAGSRHAHAATDSEGRFEIADLDPGRWELEARAHRLDRARREVELSANAVKELRLTLGRGATIKGRVLLPDGSPCTDGQVREVDFAGAWHPRELPGTLTDGFGDFVLHLGAGSVQVSGSVARWAPSEALTLQLEPGEIRQGLTLVVREPCRIRGQVFDPSGAPAFLADPRLTYPDGTVFSLHGYGGSFDGTNLPPGPARLATGSWPDVWSAAADVELVPYQTIAAELRMRYLEGARRVR